MVELGQLFLISERKLLLFENKINIHLNYLDQLDNFFFFLICLTNISIHGKKLSLESNFTAFKAVVTKKVRILYFNITLLFKIK